MKLTDVCDFQGGSQPPKNQWSDEPKEGYIRMLQIRDFTQDNSKVEYVKITNSTKKCEEKDILIARYGASIGKILTGLSGAYNVAMMKVVIDENIVDRKFIYNFLKSDVFQNYIKNVGQRAAQAGFNKGELSKININLPTLKEQKNVAKELDKDKEIKDIREKQIEQLDELIKSQFVEIYGTEKDTKYNTKTLIEITKKEPNSIKRGPFGGSLKKEDFVADGYLVYEQRHAIHNDFEYEKYYITEEKYKDMQMFKVKPKDLLISCSGVTLGKIAEVPENAKKGIINQALLKITLDSNIMNNIYFIQYFRSDEVQEKLFSFSRGSGIPNFPSMNEVKKIRFICPPIELQNKFANFVKQIDKQKFEIQKSLKATKKLQESLMNKYFG